MRIFCLLSIVFCLSSCKPCKELTGTEVQTLVEYRDTILPGATVADTIFLPGMAVNVPVVITDTASRVKLSYWKNQYNQLLITCQANDRPAKLRHTRQTITITKTRIKVEQRTPWYSKVASIIAAIIIVLVVLKK